MSKLRRKFIATLAVLFCALIALSTAFLIPEPKTANAATRTGSWNEIGEIYSGNGKFDTDNMALLYEAITGEKNATYDTVRSTLNDTNISSEDNGYRYLTSQFVRNKNSGKNVSVTFGGIKWDVTYITTARSTGDDDKELAGNIIIDLWQSMDTVTEESVFTDNNAKNVTDVDYPSGMYTTSYLRVVSLNAGGKYTKDGGDTENLVDHDKENDPAVNTYARFTSESASDSLTQYLVKPKNVAYQESEVSIDNYSPGTYSCPNDAYGTPKIENWYSSSSVDMSQLPQKGTGETAYGYWQNDYIWIPSVAETSNTDNRGVWKTDSSLRSSVSLNIWLRSGDLDDARNALILTSSGRLSGNSASVSNKVRPALHFNLTKAAGLYAPKDVSSVYNGAKQNLSTLDNQPAWYTEFSALYSNSSIISVTYPTGQYDMLDVNSEGYKVTVTILEKDKYRWADSTDPATDYERTFRFKITPKPIKLNTLSVTEEGVVSGGTIIDGQIYSSDTDGRRPEVRLVYSGRNATVYPQAGGDKYTAPTRPGNYTVKAEIVNSDTCKNYVLDKTYSKDYTIEKLLVDVPTPDTLSPTYTGKEISFVFHYYDKENVKLSSDGGMPYEENEGDKTITFKATDAGKYTVKFALNDPDGEKVWNDNNRSTIEKTVELEIKQAELRIKFSNSSVTGNWAFGWGSNVDISISGEPDDIKTNGEGVADNIELYVVYSSTSNPSQLPIPSNPFNISDTNKWLIDTYTLSVSLANANADNKNKNYILTGSTEKQFVIISPEASFSGVTWQYTNPNVESGIYQQVPSGTVSYEVTYNKGLYEFSIDESGLYNAGVELDKSHGNGTGYEGTISGKDAFSEYVQVTVYLVARDGYQELPQNMKSFTLTWRINKADFNLDEIKPYWAYTVSKAGGATVPAPYPNKGIQYEGGDEITVMLLGLPDGLEVDIYGGTSSSRFVSEVPYKVWVSSFKINDTNYNVPEVPSKGWVNFEWSIVKRELPTGSDYWTPAGFSGGKVNNPPTLITSPYNAVITYKYYRDNNGVPGEEIDESELIYVEGEETYFFVEAILDAGSAQNFYLGTAGNPYRFKVGQYLTPVTITISFDDNEDFFYNGKAKEAFISNITGSGVTVDSFVIVYYAIDEDGNETVCATPVNVGKYKVVVTLNSEFGATHMITNENTLEFEIKTLVLEAPTFEGDLTYNGQERDVAALIGIPDGWENYLEISIIRQGGNSPEGHTVKITGTYTVTFTIKDGINSGNVNNVEWNSATNKTGTKTVTITVKQLVLHAQSWEVDGYYTALVFQEENAEQFVTYTVRDKDGNVVDAATYYSSIGEKFTVEVTVGEEHGDNVTIEFVKGVKSTYELISGSEDEGNGGNNGDEDLEDKKEQAKKDLEDAANKKKDEIDNNPDLTDEEKKELKDKVDEELQKGKDAIDSATSSSGIDSAFKEGKKNIEDIGLKKDSSSFPWWIIAVVAGVLALLAVLIIVIVKRRQAADGEDEYDDFYDDEYDFDEEIEEDDSGDFGDEDF